MADQASEERYRKRWTRSVPALEAELAAIDLLYQAEAAAGLSPTPENEVKLARAEAEWRIAQRAYDTAVRADRREQNTMKVIAQNSVNLGRLARIRDEIIEIAEDVVTSQHAWNEHSASRAHSAFTRVQALAETALLMVKARS